MKHQQLIDALMCGLDAVSYEYPTRSATLYLPKGHCCDMRGAINYAVHHWPDVQMIYTKAGNHYDTVYERRGGEWVALVGDKKKAR